MGVNKILITLYALGCIHHSVVGLYSIIGFDISNATEARVHDLQENKFRYLSTWNFVLQIIYSYLALIVELLPLFKRSVLPAAKVAKGTFFSSIIFPAGIFAVTIFWGLHMINRDYVLPPGSQTALPDWMNHCIHTVILYLLIVEILLGELYLPKYLPNLLLSTAFTVIYTVQFFVFRHESGRWLYGIMYYLNIPGIIIFTLCINIYFIVLAFISLLIVRKKSKRYILTEQEKKKLPYAGKSN